MNINTTIDMINLNKIIEEISILESKDIKLIYNYNKKKIFSLSQNSTLILLDNINNLIEHHRVQSYKLKYYDPLCFLITQILLESYNMGKKIDLYYNSSALLKNISTTLSGNIYLNLLDDILQKNYVCTFDFLLNITTRCSYLSFIYWYNNSKNFDIIELFKISIVNSDDRIFKFLLEKISYLKESDLNELIINLLNTEIPTKYKLKRIKLLSTKIHLSNSFKVMIKYSNNLKMINTLAKYYYNLKLDIDDILSIFNSIIICKEAYIFYNLLKTNDEKNMFAIFCNANNYFDESIRILKMDYVFLNKHYIEILQALQKNIFILYSDELITKMIREIFSYYVSNGYINKYLQSQTYMYNIDLLKYTKYFVNKVNLFSCIRVNKLLFLLRCLMKRKYNQINNKKKFISTPLINEIKNYKPNISKPVLNNGSLYFQIEKQKFNKIPPRHLLPYENIIGNTYLIKEKADGILSYTIPNTVQPNIEIFNYEIKAEYIEELNLYLVYDINLNTSIYERQLFLRNIHPYTKNKNIINVSNFEDLIDEIKKERENLNNFLNDSKIDDIKWYPKGAWITTIDKPFYFNLIDIISELNINNSYLLKGSFDSDGLILTPLDGSRELKIKPKHLQTIDLLYDGKNWIDSDKNVCNFIQNIKNKTYLNKIYRCFPVINNDIVSYIPINIRYDKKYANPKEVIEQIYTIYNFNWQEVKNDNYYELKKQVKDINIINILNKQRSYLETMINNIKPGINKNWLDLGCGKCKLFNYINNIYLPKYYLGVDNDLYTLSKNTPLLDKYSNYHSCSTNLATNWINFNNMIKYNYIIANFSLMHFCTDYFWEQLDKIVIKDSIFLFNLVKPNQLWKYDDSYLISDNNNCRYKFEWVHNKEHNEELIEYDKILFYIEKYGWKLVHKVEFEGELSDCYYWFNLVKI
jgi:hypothetical protein